MFILNLLASAAAKESPGFFHLPLPEGTEQPTYFIARILMQSVSWILNLVGLNNHSTLFLWLYAILVFVVSVVLGYCVQWLSVKILNTIGPHVKNQFYKYLVQQKFFTKICRIIPALIFLILIEFTLYTHSSLSSWLSRVTWIYVIFIVCDTLTTLADVIWKNIDNRANKKRLPLNGVVQLVKLLIWIIFTIVVVAILINKSPGSLLAGLGAFSAVLLLVFKDNIMGVVAGVQLAQNDSLHEGDWIAPNGSDANGVVVGVSLTAIKIQNWDKTISTIPPYNLVSQGFKNYRSMQLSQTRRIQRSYMIDADSVVETDSDMLEEFKKIPLLSDWITKKIAQRDSGQVEDVNNKEGLVDGSIDTNLGIFRAYMKLWLLQNPNISSNDDLFVNTLAQTNGGIPFQVYCFTSTSAWIPYEGIQSGVFEHIAAMLGKFRLYVFENPSGRDTIAEGYLGQGTDPAFFYGAPYPFSQTPAGTGMQPYSGSMQQVPNGNIKGSSDGSH